MNGRRKIIKFRNKEIRQKPFDLENIAENIEIKISNQFFAFQI